MQIRCPHCQNPIEVLAEQALTEIVCDSCGSDFSLLAGDETSTCLDPEQHQLGQFNLVGKLGVGHFGTVWRARDSELDRDVAIKIPRAEQLGPEQGELFLREARAAAQLKHPNIVPIYEVGRDGDTLYIVSALIEGVSLSDFLTGQRLTLPESAELCMQVAEALHHAHQSGVVHRDLKPSNIMIDKKGQPHVLDFGLAKRDAGETTMTIEGKILGTPAYMPPEQARGEGHRADARSDVYSLGVMLFELMTGELPFRGNGRMVLHQVLHEEAPSPRSLNNAIPRDLETICSKCLDKEPKRRYQSAADLAADLHCWTSGEPILARPISRPERAWRWSQRNPLIAGLSATIVLLLLTATAVSSYFSLAARERAREARISEAKANRLAKQEGEARKNEKEARDVAESALQESQRQLLLNYVQRGMFECKSESPQIGLMRMLQAYQTAEKEEAFTEYEASVRNLISGWSTTLGTHCLLHPYPTRRILFSGDNRFLLVTGPRNLSLWDVDTGQPVGVPIETSETIEMTAINHDGSLAVVSYMGHLMRVWDLQQGQTVGSVMPQQGRIACVLFSPDQKQIVTGDQAGVIWFWDIGTSRMDTRIKGHTKNMWTMAINPGSKELVTTSLDNTIRFWDLETRTETRKELSVNSPVKYLCFGAEKDALFAVNFNGHIVRWDLSKQTSRIKIISADQPGLQEPIITVGAEGKLLVGGGQFNSLRFWSNETSKEIGTGFRIGLPANMIACSHDGNTLAACYTDNTVRIWKAPWWQQRGPPVLTKKGSFMSNVQFSHDGRYIIDVSEKRPELISVRAIELQNPTNMKESELSLGAKVTAMKAADHSPRLLVGDAAGNVSIWQLATGERIAGPFETMAPVKALAWNVTEELVAAGGQDGSVCIWEVSTGKERKMSRNFESVVTALVFTRDEKFLIAGCRQGLYWFDTSSGKVQHSRPDIKDTSALAISPNGKFLLQGSHANSAQILDLETGKRVGALLQDRRRVTQVAFSPDSLTAATAGENQSVNVWDVLTGESRGESLEHPESMVGLRFDVNGWLQSGSVTRIAPRWKIPRTTNVDSQRLRTWLETLTTMEITEEGLIQQLTYEKWCKRSKQLHRLGGPPNLFPSVSRESK